MRRIDQGIKSVFNGDDAEGIRSLGNSQEERENRGNEDIFQVEQTEQMNQKGDMKLDEHKDQEETQRYNEACMHLRVPKPFKSFPEYGQNSELLAMFDKILGQQPSVSHAIIHVKQILPKLQTTISSSLLRKHKRFMLLHPVARKSMRRI